MPRAIYSMDVLVYWECALTMLYCSVGGLCRQCMDALMFKHIITI